ncbi:glycosyltransferase family 2 protein [Leuconostoc mesenteroides subsp. mesenteroides]|uniref:glycosyltransferase n=1 Tax=Leuconostoc mesenteroides TaxID=1245 RepID=UPI000E09A4BD|nr:glycosyltransferase [Leuconostoc mesenteroides]RDF88859.1 glycosyltransferase family 2 protein [Leuconostoc mesenteroides subsp. mesenteroides]
MIGAVIVTYNPKIDLLEENINAIKEQVSSVLVVDNGSINFVQIEKLVIKTEVHLLPLNQNMGIAIALNEGLAYFKNLNFMWAITLDQDSIAPNNLIEALTSTDEFKYPNIGIIAADFIDASQDEIKNSKTGISEYSKRVITSGSLTNVAVWDKVGRFDNQLFIDYVDHDFNQRVMEMGFKIFQVNDVYFRHSLGEKVSSKKNILAKLFYKQVKGHAEHSAFRQYYIYRNGVIFIKRYSKHPFWDFIKLISDIRWIMLFSSPIKQSAAAAHGVIDGLMYSPKKDTYFQRYLDLKKNAESSKI